jgi:pimeloyl-ACP methyl ester carboxylesterase
VLTYVGSSIYTVEPVPGFGRFPGWIEVAQFLEELWQGSAASETATAAPTPPAAAGGSALTPSESAGPYTTSAGRQLSVICGESPNPETAEAVSAQIEASYARAGLSPWPLVASCEGWTARAAAPYLGPWDNPTPVPVLVIGNTYDPATPFSGSVRLAQELGDARLLVVNGFGHTVLINPSTCAQDYIADYLVSGVMPPLGATCTQDRTPFPGN